MASREDSLVDIPRERWLELRTRFSRDFPAGFTAYACILMQDTTLKEHPDFPLIVCAPFGNPDYGVVCIWPHTEAIVEISLYSSSEENPKIYEALMQTKRIDWRKRVLFACVMPNVVPCACSVLSALGIKFGRDDTYVAYISKEEAKLFEVDIPPDVVLSSPRLEDVELMNSVWPHRYPGSERYYSFMVEWGRGLAVYGSAPSNDLRAWVFSGLRGEMHAIHVMDDHRRKGYAQLLLKVLGKQLAENDCEVFGCIVLKNAPSKAMFLKLGFNFVATTTWIFSL